jgi:DNA-binding XRE family transcriptional regulator
VVAVVVQIDANPPCRSTGSITGRLMPPGAATARTPALYRLRIERALHQQELAELAGVHRTSVVRGENGFPLRLAIIRALATALQVEPADLMRETPEQP